MSEEALRKHLVRAEPHATAYAARVNRVVKEYVPPYDIRVGGWDTRFQPMKEGQAYYPIPLVWAVVNIYSSLMGMRPPVFNMEPKSSEEAHRESAANAEMLIRFEQQRQNMKEVHLDLCKVLSLKGRAGVKVGYTGKDLWTENIDNIENLWASFANDSYRQVNAWSYHQVIDRDEAKDTYGWRDENIGAGGGFWQWVQSKFTSGNKTKSDPFGRWAAKTWVMGAGRDDVADFDGVPLIDFHFREFINGAEKVVNEVWIGSQRVDRRVLAVNEFPYLVVNAEQEPGNPFGIGDAEPVMVLQREVASLRTKWHEAIRRNGLDTWLVRNIKALNPIDLDGGGRYFMVQGDKDEQNIDPLKYPIDDIGYKLAVEEVWEDVRRTTGIPPEVWGGGNITAGTSGYAMAVKFQSVITRLGPRQTRLGTFYMKWAYLTLKNMEVVDPDTKQIIADNYYTTIDWENITPKDFAQQVTSLATAVSSGIMSHRSAMEDLGLVSEDEETYIREWNRNPETNPAAAMAIIQAKGQAQAIAEGNPAAAGNAQAKEQNLGMPDMKGENQFTSPRAASRPGAAEPVSVNPA